MDHEPHRYPRRSRGGAASFKLLCWVLILFAAYSAYKFSPIFFAKSNIKRAIGTVIQDASHHKTDDAIRKQIIRKAAVASLSLDEGNIEIDREGRHGERIFHVAVAHPMTIDYLGSERTVRSEVSVTEVIRVNEAAEERREQRLREEEAERERKRRINEQRQKITGEMWAECEAKHGKGNCRWTQLPRSDSGEEFIKAY